MGLSDGDSRSVPVFNQADLVNAIVKGYYGDGGYNSVQFNSTETATEVEYYDLQGRRLNQPIHGINIVRMSDGSVRKIMRTE